MTIILTDVIWEIVGSTYFSCLNERGPVLAVNNDWHATVILSIPYNCDVYGFISWYTNQNSNVTYGCVCVCLMLRLNNQRHLLLQL